MQHITLGKFTFTTSMALLLAACSSNGSSLGDPITISPAEQATRTFASDAGEASDALDAGTTLTARSVSIAGQNLNYDSGETELADSATASLRRTSGTNTIVVTVNGQEYTFTDAQITDDGYGYRIENPDDGLYVTLYNQRGTIREFLEGGNDYVEIFNFQASNIPGVDPADLKAYFVVGTETADEALPSLASATYTGDSRFDVVPDSDFESQSTDRTRVRSDVTLNADFAAGEISGTMDNFRIRDPEDSDYVSINGTMSMDQAEFTSNGFESSLTADDTFTSETGASLSSATYSGAFYGPEAEEVAGVISLEGSSEDGGFNGIGYFSADREDD